MANVITFLASDAASFVTGTSINLDGGTSGVLWKSAGHFTSVTGTSTRWRTLVATEPSIIPCTEPRPRVPMTTSSQPFDLTYLAMHSGAFPTRWVVT